MANTIDAGLLINTLSDRAKTTLGARLAPLGAFTRDFSTDKYVQTKAHVVQVTTGGSTTQKNPTNFESGDSTTSSVAVTIDHYSQSFHVTTAQLNQRIRLESLIDKNLQALSEKLMDVAMTPIDATNFTASSGIIAQSALAATDLQAAWASVAKSPEKNLLLDATAFSKFLPTNLQGFPFTNGSAAYGFDHVYLNTRWTGAVAGTYGFACGPDAIAQASGIPDVHPAVEKLLLEHGTVSLDNGLAVSMCVWGSTSSRSVWASFDLMYGAAYGGDGAATGYRIKSA